VGKRYRPWPAYCQAKPATLLFSLKLDRIARAEGWTLKTLPPIAAMPSLVCKPRVLAWAETGQVCSNSP
jgi:hypothetical protein